MNPEFVKILEKIADEHGIRGFTDKTLCQSILSEYLAGEYKREIKLVSRIARVGYVNKIAKANDFSTLEDWILDVLHKDESLDLDVATDLSKTLFNITQKAKEQEAKGIKKENEENIHRKQQERESVKQKMYETLESSLIKIIKSQGLQILDNTAFCRAMLKDMAKGEFVDEITLMASLLEQKIQKQILKPRLFKIDKDVFISHLSETFSTGSDFPEQIKLTIEILVNSINIGTKRNKSEGGMKKWIATFFKYSTK